ncbi:hypothetical protein LY76DRAFT_24392 [Colletotrichum caudatum]|nr:hypothetical protein LY76DRAFT_24392 [Colletotrichum caudatum]
MDCPVWYVLPPSRRSTWEVRPRGCEKEDEQNPPGSNTSLATYSIVGGLKREKAHSALYQAETTGFGCYVLLHLNLGREISKRPSKMPSGGAVPEKVCLTSLQPTRLSTKLRHTNSTCPWTCLLGPVACFWRRPLPHWDLARLGKLSVVLPAIVQLPGRGGLVFAIRISSYRYPPNHRLCYLSPLHDSSGSTFSRRSNRH